jgi:hypothetical protein
MFATIFYLGGFGIRLQIENPPPTWMRRGSRVARQIPGRELVRENGKYWFTIRRPAREEYYRMAGKLRTKFGDDLSH